MEAILIFYDMKNIEPKKRTKLLETLFGKVQQSNFGSYSYQIKALLPEKSYIKPVRASLIIKKRYAQAVEKLFTENAIFFKKYTILLTPEDFEQKEIF